MNSPILTITLNPAIDKVYAIDNFEVDKVFRPREMTATAGGKGLNVSRVAQRLGEPVVATGFVGGGNGQYIEKRVIEAGIVSEFVQIEGESRICIAVMDQPNHTSTEILEPGPTISAGEIELFFSKYRQLLKNCAVVTASGSLPKGIPADFYAELIKIAKQQDVKFILDSSGESLLQGIKASPYMIKPNLEEVEKILGYELNSLEKQAKAISELKKAGVEMPCITLGEEGCIASLLEGVFYFYSDPIDVLNTVGSGDSFVAGCAVGFARQMNPIDQIKLGMASGMANTQFFETGMISLELVQRFLSQIKYRQVK